MESTSAARLAARAASTSLGGRYFDLRLVALSQAVMSMLHELFCKFDEVCEMFNIYKVETIGDVSGAPARRASNQRGLRLPLTSARLRILDGTSRHLMRSTTVPAVACHNSLTGSVTISYCRRLSTGSCPSGGSTRARTCVAAPSGGSMDLRTDSGAAGGRAMTCPGLHGGRGAGMHSRRGGRGRV